MNLESITSLEGQNVSVYTNESYYDGFLVSIDVNRKTLVLEAKKSRFTIDGDAIEAVEVKK